MNAAEREVHANGRDDQSAQAEPSPTRRSHRSLEGRLIERILSLSGNPPIEIVLWTGERARPPGVEVAHEMHIADRSTLMKLFTDSQLGFGDAYSEGRITVTGDLVAFIEKTYQGDAENAAVRGTLLQAAHPAPRAAFQYARRLARQHSPPLRHRQRVLRAVARQHHGLHLRLLSDARCRAR